MPNRISIVLPGLFDLPLAELEEAFVRARLPWLNRILRLADPVPNRAFDIDAMIARALGLEATGGTCLPLAQAQLEPGVAAAAQSLLCEAVHLRPDLRSAVVVPITKNEQNLQDIDNLIRDLKDLFKVDFDMKSLPGGRYLLQLKAMTAPRHYPHVLSALGKPVSPYVEQARENLPWYRLLNEIQMFLHQHRINTARAAAGLATINSLWFWGGGPAPATANIDVRWYGDDVELERFAASLGLETRPLETFATTAASAAVVVDLRLLEALKSAYSGALEALLLALEQQIFAPAFSRVANDGLHLRLYAGFDCNFELGPHARLRFWRRPRCLFDWAAADNG